MDRDSWGCKHKQHGWTKLTEVGEVELELESEVEGEDGDGDGGDGVSGGQVEF